MGIHDGGTGQSKYKNIFFKKSVFHHACNTTTDRMQAGESTPYTKLMIQCAEARSPRLLMRGEIGGNWHTSATAFLILFQYISHLNPLHVINTLSCQYSPSSWQSLHPRNIEMFFFPPGIWLAWHSDWGTSNFGPCSEILRDANNIAPSHNEARCLHQGRTEDFKQWPRTISWMLVQC